MKKTLLPLICIYVMLLLLGCSPAATGPNQPSSEPVASESNETANRIMAPNFTVYDGTGQAVKLSDFRGKPVVLNFWASWCGPCKREMPDFNAACSEFDGQVQFLMVNLTDGTHETVEIASEFISEQGYTFPVYYDTQSMAASVYGVSSIPTTYFIDAEGYAVARAVGAINAAALQNGIQMILP